jgi:hypothetical protein
MAPRGQPTICEGAWQVGHAFLDVQSVLLLDVAAWLHRQVVTPKLLLLPSRRPDPFECPPYQ